MAAVACTPACTEGDTAPLAPAPSAALPNLGAPPQSGPPNNVVGGFTIQVPEITLQPGEETFPCFIFPLDVTGPSNLVGGGKLVTTAGLHHGNVTTRPKDPNAEGMRPCEPGMGGALGGEADDILKGGSVLFGSSTQFVGEEWQSFPEGMAYQVTGGYEIVARLHYLNASAEPITVMPMYEWFTVEESSVTQILGAFAWQLTDWELPPQSETTITAECLAPGPMQIVNVLPHMHKLGTSFFGEYVGGERDGERWLDSAGYDPDNGVMTQYVPAIDVTVAEKMRFGCTWQNPFDKTIVEGVGDNEMCILFGYAYPYENAYTARATPSGCIMIASPPPGGD